jgi:hypothetical protein
MRALLADLRYGLADLLQAPLATSRAAAWLLAGVLLGAGLAHWVDAPLAAVPTAALPTDAPRVPAARLLGREAEGRLRCLVGHPSCSPTPPPSPCPLPTARPLES